MNRLSKNEWAVICTIRSEPNYRFIGDEGRMAERMVKKGLLHRDAKQKGKYYPTSKGYEFYFK